MLAALVLVALVVAGQAQAMVLPTTPADVAEEAKIRKELKTEICIMRRIPEAVKELAEKLSSASELAAIDQVQSCLNAVDLKECIAKLEDKFQNPDHMRKVQAAFDDLFHFIDVMNKMVHNGFSRC